MESNASFVHNLRGGRMIVFNIAYIQMYSCVSLYSLLLMHCISGLAVVSEERLRSCS